MIIRTGFDLPNWQCSYAIARLFFEDGNLKKLAQQVSKLLSQRSSSKLDKLSESDDSPWVVLNKLIELYPKLDVSLERHPLQWIRFGFYLQRNGAVISDSFLRSYSHWREQCANERGGTTVSWKTPTRRDGGLHEAAYCTLDYFLHAPNLPINLESDVEIRISHVRTLKRGTKSTKVCTSDHVGSHACRLIEEKITEAAICRTIKGLTSVKDNRGRYLCQMTRIEFTKALCRKYSVLSQFKESTIVRALSDFVACSRPRTS